MPKDLTESTSKAIISIIVPVYNTEKYLSTCIDSIISQSFKNWELLLIDDGSSDHSPAICDQYAAADTRIRVFHKTNGGVSSARNLGINHSSGDWITFIDADDWIESDFLIKLYSIATANGSDICACDINRKNNSGDIVYPIEICCPEDNNVTALNDYIINPWSSSCCYLIKKSIIDKHALRYYEGITVCEDFHFMVKLIFFSQKRKKLNEALYNYRLPEQNSCRVYDRRYESARMAYNDIIKFFTENGIYNHTRKVMAWRMISACIDLINSSDCFDEFITINKKYKDYILSCPYISRKLKFIMWCLTHNLKPISSFAVCIHNKFTSS